MNRRLSIMIIAVVLFACEKDVETPNWKQDPVFWFSADINGMSYKTQAGVNDYYMYAGFKDSARLPREHYGRLTIQDCPTCPNNIELSLRNYVVGELFNPDSSFKIGAHPFLEPYAPLQANARVIQFEARLDSSHGQAAQVYWDFGDGQTSTDLNPMHIYDLTTAPTIVTCSLYVAYTSGCTTSSYQNITLRSSCYANFEADVTGYSVQFASSVQSDTAVDYSWDFGDGYYSSEDSPSHQYATAGIYSVKLTITDQSSGCSSSYRRKVSVGSSLCNGNCHYEPVTLHVNNDWAQKRHMALDYRDAHGQLWSSAYAPQPDTSSLLIERTEPYLINEMGNPTYKIEGVVNCLLFLPDLSDTLVVKQGTYAIGMAYES